MSETARPLIRSACFPALLVLANAAICGVLSGVNARYRTRMVWSLALAMMAFAPVAFLAFRLDGWRALPPSGARPDGHWQMTGKDLTTDTRPARNLPIRYIVAAVGAFAVDLVLALTLREGFGLPVWLAAATSFIVVGAGAYFVHEHWTFSRAASRTSAGRFARNIAALLAAFATRVSLIALMEAIHDPEALLAATYIAIGAAASLTVNFLLNRFWVFKPPT